MAPQNKENNGGGQKKGGRGKRIEERGSETNREEIGGEDYRRRRDRNNQAVKRSRVKSKLRTQQTLERVNQLKTENEMLKQKICMLTKELGFLKDLFLAHAGSAHGVNLENVDLESLLQEELKTESDRIISLQEGERLHLGREDGKPEFK
ncbi:CCAAT/enhancer-binding protein gamma-like isoform X2 [Cryptotermes secundus]|uniref:CCAAT/enhancer-binding protein gamma-like isoform X2 n=1 Tax=Cryptotermes secundus TaxID=105785 RepID=UPI000CD7AE45|nr:CCAAT/enhancer-binding protein gamma-like isoform X2 [Cryptotermes secundus]XP_033610477.1 CCAAT/enhancer-binding protein gamma-like isoform X2 [Cryptotermes secundus]XP_033610478.1 CCAAT/enhancer-binding protein gamma-like isoform X2 [Cryptotermes secundus]